MHSQIQSFNLGMLRSEVTLEDHNPLWSKAFEFLEDKLSEVCGPTFEFYHVGSTSVPGISAKPILDVLGVAQSLEALDQIKSKIESLGFFLEGRVWNFGP
ncbi:MAG TPA: hypothetical protein DCL41_09735 [Bdellovibrionales bacterium]|nr:hypothetical protein [Pseudobdellovibrionaceae bacterium]HAG92143.1 hypothetical protein [Bdellovibrionales bacterium]|tara:strand:+ start:4643 stop:4942 length:300 start_codon:yes stop_codon:yes gene_type:complete